MLTDWKRLGYRAKVKVFVIVGIFFLMDLLGYMADAHTRELQKYGDRVEALNAEIVMLGVTVDRIAESLEATKNVYRDKLMTIVATVYEREFYNMGGYETANGAGVTEIYEAILNEVQDYRSMLRLVDNYFDTRKEYLDEVPSVWPIEYNESTRITSGFGWRVSPISGEVRYHSGMDIAGVWDAKIIASADGIVTENWLVPGWYGGVRYKGHKDLGGMIKIQHAGGFETVYGHLNKSFVHEGYEVKRGDVIGIIGNTGTSKGRHLHYELYYNGKPVNPLDHLQF